MLNKNQKWLRAAQKYIKKVWCFSSNVGICFFKIINSLKLENLQRVDRLTLQGKMRLFCEPINSYFLKE